MSAPWWQEGVVYQVYPRSFQDSDGDGVGDLEGIRRRLPYLKRLGVDAVWISPIFPSPMADFGYDVSDYTDVHPLFGSLEDLDRLLADAHAQGLRILLDLVPNHTSDQHPWFQEALAGRGSPRRDWYVWRDPAPDGGPPNNWLSYFGGPAWTLDEASGQYYLHQFLPEQPELNHRNPRVREAILDVMRFWLDRGVDGFRVDVLALMVKHPDFPDDPPNPDYREGVDHPHTRFLHVHRQDQPEVHQIVRDMRAVCDAYGGRVLIGEIYMPPERLVAYYGERLDECHLPFFFGLIELEEWSAPAVRALVERYEAALPEGAWPNYVLGNHDQPRVASRIGSDQARAAQMLLLTLRGTPTLYYGDELGMTDVDIPRERWQDPAGLRQGDFTGGTRDPERTPMPWDGTPHAGFCPPEVEPWLPLGPDAATRNVASQEGEPGSMLEYVRRLLAARRSSPALRLGGLELVDGGDPRVLAYVRHQGAERRLVVLHLGAGPARVSLASVAAQAAVVVASDPTRTGRVELEDLELAPGEGLLLDPEGA